MTDKPLEMLVVDDDVSVRRVIARILEREGVSTTQAEDGQDALNKYVSRLYKEGKPFDAILTDLTMPILDGAELTGRVKMTTPSTQVIVITGYEATEEYQKLKEKLGQAMPDGILTKPLTAEELKHALNQIKFVIETRKTNPHYKPEPLSYKLAAQS